MARQESKEERQKWLEEVYGKICAKMSAECDRVGDKIPYVPENGRYTTDWGEKDIFWWTNGFWGGMLWQMYHATGDEKYRKAAEGVEKRMDTALADIGKLYHDVGFMWLHTAVADYRLTGSEEAKKRGVNAANVLAARFNPLGNFIRAWNGDNQVGWIIIDCLMNLPILYWMSEESKDPRFAAIAKIHVDTAIDKLLRPDGSCNHIGILTLKKYKVLGRLRGLIPLHSEIYIVLSRHTLKSLNVIIRDLYGLRTRSLTDQLFHRYFPVGRLFMLLMLQIHLHRLLENTCGQFRCLDCKGNCFLCCFLLHSVPPS